MGFFGGPQYNDEQLFCCDSMTEEEEMVGYHQLSWVLLVGGDLATAFFVVSLACGGLVAAIFKAASAGGDFTAPFFVAALEGGFLFLLHY
jgi:hypothetical protein